jgi:heat shock protein HslJ
MEGSDSVTALVVDSVIAMNAEDGCAALRLQDAIAAQGWRLVSLHDTNGPLPLPKDNQGTFVWDRNEGRFAGNSGCNRYSAMGTLRGTTLAVGPAIGTKMACLAPEADAMESRLLSLLSALPSLRLVSDTLVFSVGPSDVARFVPEAVRPSAMD